jgi:hypothetical protein
MGIACPYESGWGRGVAKHWHEFRDPVHAFISVTGDERKIIDSRPFQRLRNVHQLALGYLIYPGATHRRFEHSLGVMELATKIFETVTAESNIRHSQVREILPARGVGLDYWKAVTPCGSAMPRHGASSVFTCRRR